MKSGIVIFGGVLAMLAGGQSSRVFADTVSIYPCKDNTLIENIADENSNGIGDGIFSGRVGALGGGAKLRAALAFDLGAIPRGSTITSVSLTLQMLQTTAGNQTHTLQRLTRNWGESTSQSSGGMGSPAERGDATWVHNFFPDSLWNNAGGDFVATPSASQTVGGSGAYTWNALGMIADVQGWLADPATNFGWLILGNETTNNTAKKFASRENDSPDFWPRLVIDFTPPAQPCPADINSDHAVNVADLLAVINGWGGCVAGCPMICPADVNHDSAVNVADLLAVINGWGACP